MPGCGISSASGYGDRRYLVTDTLLPHQLAPVTPAIQALTEQQLLPHMVAIRDDLLRLRHQVDADLAPRLPPHLGRPYPIGRCEPIAQAMLLLLRQAVPVSADPGLAAIRRFLLAGGELRLVWGVLRDRYFQNVFQLGGLYIDPGNNTVQASEPPVEVLPLAQSGMVNLRDAAHFAAVAERYWQAEIYANHVLPGLAPILPMVTLLPGLEPELQSASDYMIALFMRDGFCAAESWLATRPGPPEAVARRLRALVPPALLPPPDANADGRALALAACVAARAAGRQHDRAWRDARVRDYLSIRKSSPL